MTHTNVTETCECGGAAITKWFYISEYLDGTMGKSNKKWWDGWFYISDLKMGYPPLTDLVEAFTLVPPIRRNSWSPKGTLANSKEVAMLHRTMQKLAKDNLTMVGAMMLVLDRGHPTTQGQGTPDLYVHQQR